MMFCPKCGSILLPKTVKQKTIMACFCGYSNDKTKGIIVDKNKEEAKQVDVVDKEHEVYPLTDAECPKCGHKQAYYWTVQTRAGDEPETKFLKCAECKHIWRDYN